MIVLCAGTNANLMGSENVPKIKLQPTNLKKTLWMTGCRPVQITRMEPGTEEADAAVCLSNGNSSCVNRNSPMQFVPI